MPPEPFGRDDVAGVLDALAAEVGAPRADAASVVARGRRRVRQRRVRVVAVATFALVTIAAIVVATRQPARVTAVSTSPPPSTTTTLPPATGARRSSRLLRRQRHGSASTRCSTRATAAAPGKASRFRKARERR